jgi:hypothetical protein
MPQRGETNPSARVSPTSLRSPKATSAADAGFARVRSPTLDAGTATSTPWGGSGTQRLDVGMECFAPPEACFGRVAEGD